MSDVPQIPEDSREGFLQEIEEGRVINNIELLRMQLVGKQPDDPQNAHLNSALHGIKDGGAIHEAGGLLHGITIKYSTGTGEITSSDGSQFGDSSLIRTFMFEKNGARQIHLHIAGDAPASWEIDEAISGIQTGPDTETRRIMPERISPEHPDLKGINEIWGQSEYVDNPQGDLVMLKTIRKFNETFGPSK